MRHPLLVAAPLLLLAACGSTSDADVAAGPVVRDSAGVRIAEYSQAAFDAIPTWQVTPEPLVVIDGESADEIVDLSTSQLGTMYPDGTVFAAVPQPPAGVYRFNPDGSSAGQVGRNGEGPGEYQYIGGLTRLGGDSVAIYDLFKRQVLLYDKAGTSLDRIQFPLTGTPIPPIVNGRSADGTWIFQIINPFQQKPEDADEIYRVDGPVLTWRAGQEGYDTLFMLPGASSVWGIVEAGGQRMEMGRGVAYGANSFLGTTATTVWSTTGEDFVITGRGADGARTHEVRVDLPRRPVLEADRERYKTVAREQLGRYKDVLPPGLAESEMAKIDQTVFAAQHPSLGFMGTDPLGRLWATTGVPVLDSMPEWVVMSPEGELVGRVLLPSGTLYAASEDRVAIRRENPETGLVFIEVRGLNSVVCEECGAPVE